MHVKIGKVWVDVVGVAVLSSVLLACGLYLLFCQLKKACRSRGSQVWAGVFRLSAARGDLHAMVCLAQAPGFAVDAALGGFTALHAACVQGHLGEFTVLHCCTGVWSVSSFTRAPYRTRNLQLTHTQYEHKTLRTDACGRLHHIKPHRTNALLRVSNI